MSGANADRSSALFEYHDRLHQCPHKLVGNNTDADDLVRMPFLIVHRYMHDGNTIRASLSFLFTTVRHLVTNDYHRQKIRFADSTIDVDEVAPLGRGLTTERQLAAEAPDLNVVNNWVRKRRLQNYVLSMAVTSAAAMLAITTVLWVPSTVVSEVQYRTAVDQQMPFPPVRQGRRSDSVLRAACKVCT